MTSTYSVPGMSCQHCIDAITAEVSKVDGVTDVHVDLNAKTVAVDGGRHRSGDRRNRRSRFRCRFLICRHELPL